MKLELLYYKLLSMVYNLLPNSRIKDMLEVYANSRFPVVENEIQPNARAVEADCIATKSKSSESY